MRNLEGPQEDVPAKDRRQKTDQPAELRESEILRSAERQELIEIDLAIAQEPGDQARGQEQFEPEGETPDRSPRRSRTGCGFGFCGPAALTALCRVGQDPFSSSHARQSSGRNIRSAPVRATAER